MAKEKNRQVRDNRNNRRNNQRENRENRENRINERDLEAINKKTELVKENPDAIVYVFKTKNRNEYLPIVRNIDFADIEIREEWGHGLSSDEVKEWNETLKEVSEVAKKVLDTALDLAGDYEEFDLAALKNKRVYEKINIIKQNPKADVIIINSTFAEDLFEAVLAIDFFDMPIKRIVDIEAIEEKWFTVLKEFKEAINKAQDKSVDLLVKAKTLPNGKILVGELRFPSLKKTIRIALKEKENQTNNKQNEETKNEENEE
jgi:hypothetical protein